MANMILCGCFNVVLADGYHSVGRLKYCYYVCLQRLRGSIIIVDVSRLGHNQSALDKLVLCFIRSLELLEIKDGSRQLAINSLKPTAGMSCWQVGLWLKSLGHFHCPKRHASRLQYQLCWMSVTRGQEARTFTTIMACHRRKTSISNPWVDHGGISTILPFA